MRQASARPRLGRPVRRVPATGGAGLRAATGYWRKELRLADVQAVWQSRPVGAFRGEPCIVLDDLGDRLHIGYLGHDAYRAEELGYWQVDRGVFELVAARDEVTGIVEERTDYPRASAPGGYTAPQPVLADYGRPAPRSGPQPAPGPGYGPASGPAQAGRRILAPGSVALPPAAPAPPLPLEAEAMRAASASASARHDVLTAAGSDRMAAAGSAAAPGSTTAAGHPVPPGGFVPSASSPPPAAAPAVYPAPAAAPVPAAPPAAVPPPWGPPAPPAAVGRAAHGHGADLQRAGQPRRHPGVLVLGGRGG